MGRPNPNLGPRPLNWPEALSEQVLERRWQSAGWRWEFDGVVAARFYELVHTDCESACACTRERALHNGTE